MEGGVKGEAEDKAVSEATESPLQFPVERTTRVSHADREVGIYFLDRVFFLSPTA